MAREGRGAAFVDDEEEEQEEATHFTNKDICSYTLQFFILKNVFFFFYSNMGSDIADRGEL